MNAGDLRGVIKLNDYPYKSDDYKWCGHVDVLVSTDEGLVWRALLDTNVVGPTKELVETKVLSELRFQRQLVEQVELSIKSTYYITLEDSNERN